MEKTKVTKDLENNSLVIERRFNAPKHKIWQAYADQQLFEKWWGPEGWETTTKEFDFKVGGRIHYGMKCVDQRQSDWYGKTSWGLMEIQSIDEGTSFSVKDFFSNEDGTVDETLPAQRFTVELTEENGQTVLTSRSYVNSAEELEQLIQMGMIQGFESQLDKLEAMLG